MGKRQEPDTDFYADTMEYEKKAKALTALNREKGAFAGAFADGLNRQEGIFDRAALFRTEEMGPD